MSEYFPELKSSRRRVKVELTKVYLKHATGLDTSKFAKKKLIYLILNLM